MKKSILLAPILTSALLSGCGTMVAKMGISGYPTSTYNALNITESDIDEYYSLIGKENGKVVKDEKGSYFYKEEANGDFSRFALLNQDGAVLKSALSSSVGLMEPVYFYNKDLQLELDWKETKRQYKFFTKIIGLKLLPLKTSRSYHDMIIKWAKNKSAEHMAQYTSGTGLVGIIGGSMKTASSAVSGEMGLYTPEFYNKWLSKLIKNATYLISSSAVNKYAGQEYSNRMTLQGSRVKASDKKVDTLTYNMMTANLSGFRHLSINFIPVSYFENLVSGGDFRFYSGCEMNSKSGDLKQMKMTRELTDVPYYSALSTIAKSKLSNEDDIEASKKKFHSVLSEQKKKHLLVTNACKVGFKAMGGSGVIESKKL